MAQKVDKDQYAVRVIPDNATDTGKVLNGLFKKRNLIEAAILAAPIALIFGTLFLQMDMKFVYATLCLVRLYLVVSALLAFHHTAYLNILA